MTSSELAGAVQLRIEPGTEQLRFVGLGTDVRCESLVPSALTSFYAPTSGKLNAGLVTAEGMQGPIALLRCRVRALGQAEPAVFENFTIDRIDATGPLLEPISPTFGVVDVDCSPPEQTVTTCRSRFSMTSNDVAGALQIQVVSTDPDVSFVGKASAVECSSLVPSVISAFNSASRSSVVAGFVAVSGLPGPVDLFDCAVRAVGERDAQDFDVFDIELQDASDTSFDPITPTIEHTGTTGCEVSVEPLPTSTSTTTSSSTTTPSSSTTTQTSSTTTHQTPTSSVTSTSTSMPPGNTGTVRVSMISPTPIVAGTFEVTPGDGRILGCTALDDGALILQQGNSVTICLYDENGSDTGTHALADCLVESEPPALPPVVEVKRALGTDLRPVPGVVGQVTDLP